MPVNAAATLKPDHSDISEDLSPRIQAAAQRSGLSYAAFVQQLLQSDFSGVISWQPSDVERLFWRPERLGLAPLERDLIAIPHPEPFPPSLGFMITVDGWVKLLHRHRRFRRLAFEEPASAEAGPPAWVSCTLYPEGLSCPWVARGWATEHRSLHESWLYYPHRTLRHKALAQCARLALSVGSGYWPGGVASIGISFLKKAALRNAPLSQGRWQPWAVQAKKAGSPTMAQNATVQATGRCLRQPDASDQKH